MAIEYSTVKFVARICHFVGAGLLLLLGIMEFARLDFIATTFFMNIYYILFGIVIVLTELGFQRVIDNFYFMRFYFGKSFFCGFIGILCFGSSYWVRLLTAIFFVVACIAFLILGFFYRKEIGRAHV